MLVNGKTSDEAIDEIVSLYTSGMTMQEVCYKTHISMKTVLKYIHARGIKVVRKGRPYDKPSETRSRIAERYSKGESSLCLSKEFSMSQTSVLNCVREFGFTVKDPSYHPKDYDCDYEFFSNVDCEQKAYWLGFISADDCVTDDGRLVITLSEKDVDHIVRFRQQIKGNHPIRRSEQKTKGVSCYRATMEISSPVMVGYLRRLGVTPRKTFTLQFPTISDDLVRHYCRGYADGDGGFYSYSYWLKDRKNINHYQMFAVTSNYDFVKDMQYWLALNHFLPMNKLQEMTVKNTVYQVRWASAPDVATIANILYTKSSIWLERKRNIVLHHYNNVIRCGEWLKFN